MAVMKIYSQLPRNRGHGMLQGLGHTGGTRAGRGRGSWINAAALVGQTGFSFSGDVHPSVGDQAPRKLP